MWWSIPFVLMQRVRNMYIKIGNTFGKIDHVIQSINNCSSICGITIYDTRVCQYVSMTVNRDAPFLLH